MDRKERAMARCRRLVTCPLRLLTEAAHGSLKPPPTRRLRGATPHLSYSMTLARLLDTIKPGLSASGPHVLFRHLRTCPRTRPGQLWAQYLTCQMLPPVQSGLSQSTCIAVMPDAPLNEFAGSGK